MKYEIIIRLMAVLILVISTVLIFIIPYIQIYFFQGNAFTIITKYVNNSLLIYVVLFFILLLQIFVYSYKKRINNMKLKSIYYKIKIRYIMITIILIIIFIVFSILNYIKIDNNGIYHKKHGIKYEFINWNNIKEIKIDTVKIFTINKYLLGYSINPRIMVSYDNNELDILQFYGSRNTDFIGLKKLIDHIYENTEIKIYLNDYISDNDLIYFNKLKDKYEILDFFEYIKNKK